MELSGIGLPSGSPARLLWNRADGRVLALTGSLAPLGIGEAFLAAARIGFRERSVDRDGYRIDRRLRAMLRLAPGGRAMPRSAARSTVVLRPRGRGRCPWPAGFLP